MRLRLAENAHRNPTHQRGGSRQRRYLHAGVIVAPEPNLDHLALDAVLHRLVEHDPLKAELVELRHFAGPTGEQAAAVLGNSPSSADRQWVYARLAASRAGPRRWPLRPISGPRREFLMLVATLLAL
jgi:hypothetical protein